MVDPRCPSPFPGVRDKWWHGLCVDREIREEWLERLNAISHIQVVQTCAGHPEHPDPEWFPETGVVPALGPYVTFCFPSSLAGAIRAADQAFRGWAFHLASDMSKKTTAEMM